MARRFLRWIILLSLILSLMFLLSSSMAVAVEAEAGAEEEATEEEAPTFAQLKEELDQFLTLMGEGDAEGAIEALEKYLEDLKALSQFADTLTEDELHIAHVLYVTSKHLVVLARVYQKVPDSARKGVGNAIVRSTKGHGHFYTVLEGARADGDAEEEAEAEGEVGNSDLVDRERGKGNSGGHGNGGSPSKRGKNK